eukprot:TRINITY_DN3416_c0_g1_i1.p1 TRINITY_DN3416_c0_g1~~TRINITY_DN3416_c0_g1_i1.p1  ORF type:complete len:491 (-),score=119.84 TRINITY_DN3416_c0_g1_i1:104-1552(-)
MDYKPEPIKIEDYAGIEGRNGEPITKIFEMREKFLKDRSANSSFAHVSPPDVKHITRDVPQNDKLIDLMLQKLVIIKLNGGLGSTMKCKGPKSFLPVQHGLTFLDLTIRQVEYLNVVHGCDVPIVLLNSFKTSERTREVIKSYEGREVTIHCLDQSSMPRLDPVTLKPLATESFSEETQHLWYPPGHGDLVDTYLDSDLHLEFFRQGKEYAFISNIDNLTATIDFKVLYHLYMENVDFCMEVTERKECDVKGGILVKDHDKTRLLERSQFPKEEVALFNDYKHFNSFNTNNLWICINKLERLWDRRMLNPDIIAVHKDTPFGEVVELETAIGCCFKSVGSAQGVMVSRDRFTPVKHTADLLLVQSDVYTLVHGNLVRPLDAKKLPTVEIRGPMTDVTVYQEKVKNVPSLRGLDSLLIDGNVSFGTEVFLSGKVEIIVAEGLTYEIPNFTSFHNKRVMYSESGITVEDMFDDTVAVKKEWGKI